MPLRAHLIELRKRVILASIGLLVGAVAGWVVYPTVFAILQAPVVELNEARGQLIALNFSGVVSAFDMQLKVSLFVGVLASSPWWLYQLWAFITPGLTRRERLISVGFLSAAVPLFLTGAGLAWWLLPKAVGLLTGFTPADSTNLISAQEYLTFVMRMVLAFGAGFLVPVIMVALTMVGLVAGRTWLAGWRVAVLLAFVFGAVATPTGDAISMLVLAVPITALYFAAVAIGIGHDRRAAKRAAAEELAEAAADGPDPAVEDPAVEPGDAAVEPGDAAGHIPDADGPR
ncbi:twin-arginine translocase subunit TatC [Pengzhenrongella sicca]|uniref:Sec-independent protein translocase protein TatC n=1 Tax=Pengzhenrongella sicca TaxID=2819238 RepID=A0A8A4ZB72_9MICO|nr:twin-arginine translocase subunit TatC [Pengzhenrongella sicca]QTE27836.1 twin-arginine translocase subunit TatC [Pengzhenrongella sicca]